MSIAIKVDLQKAKHKLSRESMTRGKIAVASKILLDNEQYIPLRGGELRASGRIVGQGDAVVYGTVYARAQFYGSNGIVTYTTPGTGKRWDQVATSKHAEEWARAFVKGMGL